MAVQSSTTPAASISLLVPRTYDEVLVIIPLRLFGTSALGKIGQKFFLDVIEAYIPTLLEEIQGCCADDDNRDALLAGEDAIANLRQTVSTLRGLPGSPHGYELIDAGYAAVIEAFAVAHSEEFHPEADSFADDFEAWKRDA